MVALTYPPPQLEVQSPCVSTSLPTFEGATNYTQVGKLQVALFLYRSELIPARILPSPSLPGQPFWNRGTWSLNKSLSACFCFVLFCCLVLSLEFGPCGRFPAGRALPQQGWAFPPWFPRPAASSPVTSRSLYPLLVLTTLILRVCFAHSVPFSSTLPPFQPKV